MQVSWINFFLIGVTLLSFVHPFRSDPQQSYWTNYDHQPRPLQTVPRQYDSSIVHESHVTRHERRPPIELSRYESQPRFTNYPEAVADRKHLAKKKYHNYDDFVLSDNRKEDDSEEINFQEEDAESDSKEIEIMEKFRVLDRLLSEDSREKDVDTNVIEDKIIPEESKRVVREVRKSKPGFFWTLARVTFEAINDTGSAIKQISNIINNNIAPDSATQASMSSALTAVGSNNITGNATGTTTTTSGNASRGNSTLTRSGLQRLIRRNVLGLVRLFNIEWKEALNQSEVSVKEFQKDLNNQVGIYLRDNPDAY